MKARPLRRAALAALACCVIATPALARKLPDYDASASTAASDVPRFLKADEAKARGKTIAKVLTAPQSPADHEARAREHLRELAATYRISDTEIDALPLLDVQAFPQGGSVVRFRNRVDGVDVFREEVKVLQDRNGNLVAIGGYATGAQLAPRKTMPSQDLTRETATSARDS